MPKPVKSGCLIDCLFLQWVDLILQVFCLNLPKIRHGLSNLLAEIKKNMDLNFCSKNRQID